MKTTMGYNPEGDSLPWSHTLRWDIRPRLRVSENGVLERIFVEIEGTGDRSKLRDEKAHLRPSPSIVLVRLNQGG
jgi:hypothetical protein